MKKFVLIEVIEREISTPEFFDTHEEAHKEMKRRFDECCEYRECDGDIWKSFAWCENANHDNCDWKIFEVEVK